jgi:hypothetical protein
LVIQVQERGLVLLGQDEPEDEEDEVGEDEQERRTRAIVSQETANVLAGLGKHHYWSRCHRSVFLKS